MKVLYQGEYSLYKRLVVGIIERENIKVCQISRQQPVAVVGTQSE